MRGERGVLWVLMGCVSQRSWRWIVHACHCSGATRSQSRSAKIVSAPPSELGDPAATDAAPTNAEKAARARKHWPARLGAASTEQAASEAQGKHAKHRAARSASALCTRFAQRRRSETATRWTRGLCAAPVDLRTERGTPRDRCDGFPSLERMSCVNCAMVQPRADFESHTLLARGEAVVHRRRGASPTATASVALVVRLTREHAPAAPLRVRSKQAESERRRPAEEQHQDTRHLGGSCLHHAPVGKPV